ncbi:conserved hypothetical protein [Neospora caninum Liverpool]|uniref:Sjogren's syndrome/scleroderma autoantigen 1 (Autoantigen p27) protein n=1 Tax=Neospora caninum (strain Liverpool) TaxID=572307 RepID=F0VK82_NEOCL|nr:conserved hypothetical protein [Neospora caninum Liverpool]CBZ54483.1 conserved hypothetical protein [Neospora caninum Liverpool]CEL69196.1 TPA: Sjogren's syndrome/scleroderma autoantigen 1 (Autoantigen p27) protein [Neospora caninum Liverpool]|eukprot:XP_003884513.1 conserved hypothetical protein [Neospora caninum Liverpool]
MGTRAAQEGTSASGSLAEKRRQAGEEQVQTASEGLAEKLLMGWTMLGDTCPQCVSVPLMRDKQQQLFCVACQAFLPSSVLDEGPGAEASRASTAQGRGRECGRADHEIDEGEETGSNRQSERRYRPSAAATKAQASSTPTVGRGVQYQMVAAIPLDEADSEKIESTLASFSRDEGASRSLWLSGGATGSQPRGDARVSEPKQDEEDERDRVQDRLTAKEKYFQASADLVRWREQTLQRCGVSAPERRPNYGNVQVSHAADRAASCHASCLVGGRRVESENRTQVSAECPSRDDALNEARTAVLMNIRRYAAALAPSSHNTVHTVESDRQVLLTLQTAIQVLETLDALS